MRDNMSSITPWGGPCKLAVLNGRTMSLCVSMDQEEYVLTSNLGGLLHSEDRRQNKQKQVENYARMYDHRHWKASASGTSVCT